MRYSLRNRYLLRDKVVLITGAAGGIGRATADELYARGASLVLADLSQQAVDQLAARYDSRRVLATSLDVTRAAACRDAVSAAIERFGRLDVVLANAGIAWRDQPATVASCDADEFEQIVEVDLLGVWRTLKAAVPEVRRNGGQLLVTSSIYATINGMANAPYAASKSAVESLARSLRAELGPTRATAGIIYPGWTATAIADIAFGGSELATRLNQTALPGFLRRPIAPQTLAQSIVRGIEKRSSHIITPARWRPVFWLRGIINPATDRYLAGHRKLGALITELESLAQDKIQPIEAAREKQAARKKREPS